MSRRDQEARKKGRSPRTASSVVADSPLGPGPAGGGRLVAWLCAGLCLAVLVLYARVAGNGFVTLDDDAYIAGNPFVRSGLTWSGVKWAFLSSREGNWHPLTW